MIYMGAKTRLMDRIKPIIESFLNSKTAAYVEPFCGGMNSISKINFGNKIASDNNKYLIAMWEALVKGHRFSHTCSKDLYDKLRKQYRGLQKFGFTDAEIGWYGFVASFNGRFYDGGYSGNYKLRDYIGEASRNIEKQISSMRGIKLEHSDYSDLNIPVNSLIYCDIPYKGTKEYGGVVKFDYDKFYKWCIDMSKENTLLISEFDMPADNFECVWELPIKTQIGLKNKHNRIERIFKVREL